MDSRDSNVQQNMPTFCKNGCGFYAASGNEGLCSVCYKEAVKKKQAPPTNMPASFSSTASSSLQSLSNKEEAASATPTAHALETAQPTVPVVRPQTEPEVGESAEASGAAAASAGGDEAGGHVGKKKVGLTGFTCRCGGLFCSIHRYSDKHECKFD